MAEYEEPSRSVDSLQKYSVSAAGKLMVNEDRSEANVEKTREQTDAGQAHVEAATGVDAPEPRPGHVDEKLFKAYELYLTERLRLTSGKQEQSKAYDQTILVYSAGAIALSITFLEKVVKQPSAKMWLYTSWILFASAMLSTLYSLLAAQKAFEAEVLNMDKKYQRLIGLPSDVSAKSKSPLTVWGVSLKWLAAFAAIFEPVTSSVSQIVRWLNRLAGALFFLGVLCFGWFALENWVELKEEKTKVADSKKSGPSQPDVQFPSRPVLPGTGAIPDPGVLPPVKTPPPPPPQEKK